MGKIFVTSDLHFGHKNIMKFCPHSRPYGSVEEMDEDLITKWNAVVSPEDEVWNLGDISFHYNFTSTREILSRLNGKHHLILGNHDQQIVSNSEFLLSGIKLDDNPYLSSIQHYKELKVGGNDVVMFHYPIVEWNRMHYGSIHLYGHLHDVVAEGETVYRLCNVGYDRWQRPVELQSLVGILATLEVKPRL